MAAVDNAVAGLAPDGIMGVADFYTSAKYDTPNRQHPFARRWFWKAVFDCDGIDLSPERRHYLEHSLEPVYEYNSSGRIPYVPYVRAPYYIWVGRHKKLQGALLHGGCTESAPCSRTLVPRDLAILSCLDFLTAKQPVDFLINGR